MTTDSSLRKQGSERMPPSEDVARIGESIGRMRLLIGRRVIGRAAIADIAPGLDISHIDVMDAMRRLGGEATVGAIADMMRIDPSRGSRLVAELVSRGILRRSACQSDGRRSLVEATKLGDRLLADIRSVKRSLLARLVEDWSEDDLRRFSLLFERFLGDFENASMTAEKAAEAPDLKPDEA